MDFKKIEKKWQKKWEKEKIFEADSDGRRKKFYCVEMFPYPSGEGLHMGHMRNYAIGDVLARFKLMEGFNVLHPMGYDSFGLPAENAAIEHKLNPKKWTLDNVKTMESQQRKLGLSYDWSRKVVTCLPNYYKWNQWLFLRMFKKGLAYKKESEVNFCPKCDTVLANEQVVGRKCWRCDSEVETKILSQWFMKITDYAEKLLKGLKKVDWPKKVTSMQRNWIGKSQGVMIDFKLKGSKENLPVFTTRPDTLFGVTFMVFAPEHPKVKELVKGTKKEKEVNKFIKKVKKQRIKNPEAIEKKKEGVFTGKYAINPVNDKKIPIYVANFVLLEYGTGMIMAVPAHDQRDFEFAKENDLPVKVVIQPKNKKIKGKDMEEAYVDQGILVNSGKFNGTNNKEAIEKISDWLEKTGRGKRSVQYKLKDWLISRQRYWGTPIPIIYCDKCGVVPVPEKELPVLLPEPSEVEFKKGNPLETCEEFVNTECPKCGGKAKRETDTMDTFVDSSWYFLRYCDPENEKKMFGKKKANYWMPMDFYTGGIEHATGHLIYSRFITKVLKDLGMVKADEPAKKLLCQGMVTLGGSAMSKSKGNVVDPIEVVKKYSADAARLFIMFAALPEKEFEWSDKGIKSMEKFLGRIEKLSKKKSKSSSKRLAHYTHKAIRDVTENIDNYRFNSAIINLMGLLDRLEEEKSKKSFRIFLKMLAPFAPHTAEELWSKMGNKRMVSLEKWPKAEKSKIDENIEKAEQMVETVLKDFKTIRKLVKKKPKKVELYVAEKWKFNVYEKMRKKKPKSPKALMKKYKGKEGSKKYIASLFKKHELEEVADRKTQLKTLKDSKDFLKEEFGCKVEIKKKGEGLTKANPQKPGILLV